MSRRRMYTNPNGKAARYVSGDGDGGGGGNMKGSSWPMTTRQAIHKILDYWTHNLPILVVMKPMKCKHVVLYNQFSSEVTAN